MCGEEGREVVHCKVGRQDGSLVCVREDAAMGLCSLFGVGRRWADGGGCRSAVSGGEPRSGVGEGQGFGSLPTACPCLGQLCTTSAHGVFDRVLCCSRVGRCQGV